METTSKAESQCILESQTYAISEIDGEEEEVCHVPNLHAVRGGYARRQ